MLAPLRKASRVRFVKDLPVHEISRSKLALRE